MTQILLSLSRLHEWRNLLDIALVSLIFYGLLLLFRGTQAVQLVRGMLVIALATVVVNQVVELTAFRWLLTNTAAVILIAIPVIFQPELRRALERVGRTAPLLVPRGETANTQRVVNEVVKAVEQMADRKTGALIVFEGATGLGEFIDRGVSVDAEVSSELLTTIFFPNTALHDGAVIVSGSRVAAASCVLPLTQRELVDSQLGTRHRAAIGVTEQADALSVVVSEETGSISVARNGRILRIDAGRLRTLLSDFFKPYVGVAVGYFCTSRNANSLAALY
jgi:diadenylate cyclase